MTQYCDMFALYLNSYPNDIVKCLTCIWTHDPISEIFDFYMNPWPNNVWLVYELMTLISEMFDL